MVKHQAFISIMAAFAAFATAPALAAQGDPIPGVDVSAQQNPGGIVAHGSTDAKGAIVFNLLPGSYRLRFKGKKLARLSITSTQRGALLKTGSVDCVPAAAKCGPTGAFVVSAKGPVTLSVAYFKADAEANSRHTGSVNNGPAPDAF